jgi:pimeloyl-[acyl-carrier protein] methyl ester esterase
LRLVFVHGWALGPEIWDLLAPLLREAPQARADLGYFGPPRLPEVVAGDLLIGHSAGLLWGLRHSADWAGVVAINSFARFTLDAAGRGCVKPAALRAMQKNLARDAPACVNAFRASIGATPTAEPAQVERLAEGLALLRDADAASLTTRAPWLVLGGENDTLAPPAASRNLAAAFNGELALHAEAGHGLPWMAPEFCTQRILEFLSGHEF